ncbi:MAG: pYEATS domain-containing protein [Bacteroidota bacterium]
MLYVEYRLHSTFRNPIQVKRDVETNFMLKSSGWGEFMIKIAVKLKNGETLEHGHWLKLGEHIEVESEPITKDETRSASELKVFLSYDKSDHRLARYVENQLSNLGVKVLSSGNLEKGKSVFDSIKDAINSSDAILEIKSEFDSAWQQMEVEIASGNNKKHIAIDQEELNGDEIQFGFGSENLDIIKQKLDEI